MAQFPVASILRADGPTLTAPMPIRQAVALLVEARAAAAPVLRDDGKLAGILSQKDCFGPALHASYHQEWAGRVADYMSERVVTLDAGDDVVRAAEMFLAHPHRVFPVLEEGRLAGMLYRSDVLALLARIG
ncbi:CBS domain-containing protein [Vannielia litorea]|uniref:CBS domain-containing protein n=1 Tax=Vannielia litorea TaxID=1217970 RepID=A0A1N6E221_9RHOB|nr:CBS domain-containing protein [Vannielia litorea]SIN77078.1 CBS domain-containing protein [Vannielia litorea]